MSGTTITDADLTHLQGLHIATKVDRKEIGELLISKGAEVNVKNNAGQTPLDLAKQREHTEIVELLKQHGAK